MNECIYRKATQYDSKEILDIYSYYIENTPASFEIETPSLVDFSNRIIEVMKVYPFFVCTREDKIIGYTYASKHRERAAYCYDIDVSIYIHKDMHGKGIGTMLYNMLFEELENENYYNAYAGITLPNEKSIALHHKFGFKDIGVYHKTGYKFNEWHDVLWLEKTLKSHLTAPCGNTEI